MLSEEMYRKVHIPEKALIVGASVAKAADKISEVSAGDLGLRYLRLSQAERERNMKLKGE